MSELRKTSEPTTGRPAEAPPLYFDARRELAAHYLFGKGLEIGPLHQPLEMPPGATVSYVDRLNVGDLRREYPELAEWDLTEADVLDDCESLSTIELRRPRESF